jgi:leader peptidase (prepilin peptidase)/N-methyltransferase
LNTTLDIIAVIAVSGILLAITIVDFRTMEISPWLICALIPCAVYFAFDGRPIWHRILGFFIISVPMVILMLVVEGAFGGADVQLIAVCGFLLGYSRTLVAMFIALLLGGVVAIALLAAGRKEKTEHIPFGPYICAGVVIAMFAGDNIISWYLKFFGL